MRKISMALGGKFESLDDVLNQGTRLIATHLDFDRALVLLANPQRRVFNQAHISTGEPALNTWLKTFELPFESGQSAFVRALLSAQPLLIERPSDLPEHMRALMRRFKTQAFAMAPLLSQGQLVGLLFVDNALTRRALTHEHLSWVYTVATFLATAITNWHWQCALENRVQNRTAELAEANARFEAFMRAIPLSAFIKDEQGRYVYFNSLFEATAQRPTADMLGRTDAELFPHSAQDFALTDQQALHGDQPVTFENRAPTVNGDLRDWWVAKFPVVLPDQRRFLAGVALDITDRKQAQAATQRHAAQMDFLRQSLAELLMQDQTDSLLARALSQASQLLQTTSGTIALYNPATSGLDIKASFNLNRDYSGVSLQVGEGLAGQVALHRQALRLESYLRWEHCSPQYDGPDASCLGAPLLVGPQLLGVITLTALGSERLFTLDDMGLLKLFAQQAALAVLNVQLFEAAQSRLFEAETLRQAGAIVAASLESDETIERILDQFNNVVAYDSATVQVRHNNALVLLGARHFAQAELLLNTQFALADPHLRRVFERGLPLILDTPPDLYHVLTVPPQRPIRSWLSVPLMRRSNIIGLITLHSHEPNRFTSSQLTLTTALADQMAIALDNAALYRAAVSAAERRTTLYRATREINTSTETESICAAVHRAAMQVMPCDMVLISLVLADANIVDDVYVFESDQLWSGGQHPADRGLVGHVLRQQQTLALDNVTLEDLRALGAELVGSHEPASPRSILAVPLHVSDHPVGVLSVQSRMPFAYSQDDRELLEMLGAHAAVAFENARLYQQALRAAERRAMLYRASHELSTSTNSEQVCTAVHRAAAQVMPAEAVVMSVVSADKQSIQDLYLFDMGQRHHRPTYPIHKGLSGYIVRTRQPLKIDLVDEAFLRTIQTQHFGKQATAQSVLAVPMQIGDNVIGMLSVQSYRAHAYTDDDLELLELLGAHAAGALENARLFEVTQQLAHMDGLTNLLNRRRFMELACKEFERTRRYNHPLAVVMFDVDHFKQVNDTYGHGVGDDVLRAVAQACARLLRQTDLLARYGGEEFVALLPDTDMFSAREVARRLREHVQALVVHDKVSVTISLGVAAYQSQASVEALLENADQALYHAKNGGRNRVVVWAK